MKVGSRRTYPSACARFSQWPKLAWLPRIQSSAAQGSESPKTSDPGTTPSAPAWGQQGNSLAANSAVDYDLWASSSPATKLQNGADPGDCLRMKPTSFHADFGAMTSRRSARSRWSSSVESGSPISITKPARTLRERMCLRVSDTSRQKCR
jgi:hypothetical protein